MALRKSLPKFGMSRNDRPGPDPATTIIAEEIFINNLHESLFGEATVTVTSIIDYIITNMFENHEDKDCGKVIIKEIITL